MAYITVVAIVLEIEIVEKMAQRICFGSNVEKKKSAGFQAPRSIIERPGVFFGALKVINAIIEKRIRSNCFFTGRNIESQQKTGTLR